MSMNHTRTVVDAYFDGNPAAAIAAISAVYTEQDGLLSRVTSQGTAMPEATLCTTCFPNTRLVAALALEADRSADADPHNRAWVDTTDNDSVCCVACGAPERDERCAECGEPMLTTTTGVAHHVAADDMAGQEVEGRVVDHDADADHTARSDT